MTVTHNPPLNPESFEEAVARLALKTLTSPSGRVMIAIAGIPGSGKTTLAQAVSDKINNLHKTNSSPDQKLCSVLPMDGFHLYRSQLAAMPDPVMAIHRRGAAFTFDAERFHDLVVSLRRPVLDISGAIYAPSFDHALKDPVEDDISVFPHSRILIFEGLYLALDRSPWNKTAELMDELWFVETDREVARSRLVKRHVATGIVVDEASARYRIASTDFLNADDILAHRLPVQELIVTDAKV
ncbi:kinase-related protein [Purpureocillium lavendulum]|uniref:Kinase-related protein n=1 Tax=Purpureocillium lavendulum TaxID=1247861 RepID=A0AB34FQ46_9HYPO|nr:kinase-related protein [Purpureocillium lavendulum]